MPIPAPVPVAVEVVATRPEPADAAALAPIRRRADRAAVVAAYLVKVRLAEIPPATGAGWALFVGELRIPKYWEYVAGIFFKVFDPQFFVDHAGDRLRFSADMGATFVDTDVTLGPPATRLTAELEDASTLPTQAEALSN
jgi:hypothetical protein